MTSHGVVNWAIVFGGFTQSTGKITGSLRCWQKIHEAINGGASRTEFRAWDDDVAELADFIFHCSREDFEPTINVFGYSWGGATAANFARCLQHRGLLVDRMVLCDPVYRHAYWLGNWRAFLPGSTIKIPANVRRVDWFRQRVNKPAGHQPVADSPRSTIIAEPIELNRRHQWMDDAAQYHAAAVSAVRGELT